MIVAVLAPWGIFFDPFSYCVPGVVDRVAKLHYLN